MQQSRPHVGDLFGKVVATRFAVLVFLGAMAPQLELYAESSAGRCPTSRRSKETAQCAGVRLAKGKSLTFLVSARKLWGDGVLCVSPGQVYRFEVTPGRDHWRDLVFKVDAQGRSPWFYRIYMSMFSKWKRAKGQPWFALIGNIGRASTQNAFLIGKSSEHRFDEAGRLFGFANDVAGFYWNNSGSLQVVVTRLE